MPGSDLIRHANGTLTGDDALATALTSKSPIARIMARGLAAGWCEPMAEWLNAELNRPGANPIDVLQGLATLQAQTLAAFAAQVMGADQDAAFLDVAVDLLRMQLPAHMAKTRQQEWFHDGR